MEKFLNIIMGFKEFLENDLSRLGDLSNSFSNEDGNFSNIKSKYLTKSYIKNIYNNNEKIQKIRKKSRRKQHY